MTEIDRDRQARREIEIEREHTIKLIRELVEKKLSVYAGIQDKEIQTYKLFGLCLFLLTETEFKDIGERLEDILYKEQR